MSLPIQVTGCMTMTATKTCRFTNTKNPNYLNIAETSDVHLGHNRTPTEFIVTNLERAFPDNPETAALDIIIFAGDVFDQLIPLPEEGVVTEVEIWILGFLIICAKYDIMVFIDEGTPRHDRKQSYLFEHVNHIYKVGATIVYSKRLQVYKCPKHNASFLFVPDEWKPDHNETYREAAAAIARAGLDKVDFAIMHGAFEYQFPAHLDLPTHDSTLWLDLVREWIFIGHVHEKSQHDRILAAGSFDRLTFGEEAPKGHWRVKCRGKGKESDEITFVENTHAMRYDTLDVEGMELTAVVKLVEDQNMQKGQNLRLLCTKLCPAFFTERELQNTFPDFRLIVKAKKEKASDRAESTQIDPLAPVRKVVAIDINRDNIRRLMEERLMEKITDESVRTRMLDLMEGVLDG